MPATEGPHRNPIATDAIVIGAGPVGLFQVFELGLLGISAQVVDSLPVVGGQCIQLYADKPIFDIPGTPRCTGRELVGRLQQQIAPFATGFHLDQEVSVVERQADGRFRVETSTGTSFIATVVVIAGGVGSFQPRRLKIDGLVEYERRQVFYRFDADSDAARFAGQRIVVIGDGDAALEAALALARPDDASLAAATVTLLHRRDEFKAERGTLQRVAQLRADGRLDFIAGQPTGIEQQQQQQPQEQQQQQKPQQPQQPQSEPGGQRLNGLVVTLPDGSLRTVPLDALFVLTGLSPKLGPIATWGLALERKQLIVDSERFQTDVPGIFAVGDVNTYPGKKKLIVCGFHEATLAAYGAVRRVFPDALAMPLEYTTTSPRLRKLLGE